MKARKSTLDELDLMVQIPRMSLGDKLESLIREVRYYRKKVDALQLCQEEQASHNTMSNKTIECFDQNWNEEELRILKESGFKA
jgi:hypothetical protein